MHTHSLKITWWGLYSFSVSLAGHTWIIDPCHRIKWRWQKRTPPLLGNAMAPNPHVLVTSAHPLRFDWGAFKFFKQTTPVYVPPGLSSILKDYFHFPLVEWTQDATTTAGPCKMSTRKGQTRWFSWSARRWVNSHHVVLQDQNTTIFILSTVKKYRGAELDALQREFGSPTLLIAPLGGPWGLTPLELIHAGLDVHAQNIVPAGYDAFLSRGETTENLLTELKAEAERAHCAQKIHILTPGQEWQYTSPLHLVG